MMHLEGHLSGVLSLPTQICGIDSSLTLAQPLRMDALTCHTCPDNAQAPQADESLSLAVQTVGSAPAWT